MPFDGFDRRMALWLRDLLLGDPMKPYIIGALVVWVLCGFAGAGLLGDHDWQTVAKGPISLVHGFNKDPD